MVEPTTRAASAITPTVVARGVSVVHRGGPETPHLNALLIGIPVLAWCMWCMNSQLHSIYKFPPPFFFSRKEFKKHAPHAPRGIKTPTSTAFYRGVCLTRQPHHVSPPFARMPCLCRKHEDPRIHHSIRGPSLLSGGAATARSSPRTRRARYRETSARGDPCPRAGS